LAECFTARHAFAVAAIDGPIHGARRGAPLSGPAMQAEFLALWPKDDRIDDMVEDWRGVLDALCATGDVEPSAIGWYGVSMGTAYGLPLVAAERRIRAAVLGMWGLDFVNSERLGMAARNVECPVLFQQKWSDQLFGREGQLRLFDCLKTENKWLKIYPGAHLPVSGEQADDVEQFLATRLNALVECGGAAR
jgi:dienelactone hydrolase